MSNQEKLKAMIKPFDITDLHGKEGTLQVGVDLSGTKDRTVVVAFVAKEDNRVYIIDCKTINAHPECAICRGTGIVGDYHGDPVYCANCE